MSWASFRNRYDKEEGSIRSFVFNIPGDTVPATLKRIKKGKGKGWPDCQYEMSVEAMKILRDLKDTYNRASSASSCYCHNLICNDWQNITDDKVLRPCSNCAKVVDIAMDYTKSYILFEDMRKRIFRLRRFDNFGKVKMLNLIQKFEKLVNVKS